MGPALLPTPLPLVAKSGHWGAGQAPRPSRLASLGVTGFRPCPSGPLAACPACHRRRLVPSGQVPLLAEASWPLTWRFHGSVHLPRDPPLLWSGRSWTSTLALRPACSGPCHGRPSSSIFGSAFAGSGGTLWAVFSDVAAGHAVDLRG